MWLNGCSRKLCPMQVGCTDNCRLTKEQCPYFTQDVDIQKLLNQIKAAVARDIFEEMEKNTRFTINLVEAMEFDSEEIRKAKLECYRDCLGYYGKLKKKHTEGLNVSNEL